MATDIDSLSYEELLELKHVIEQRLKYLDSLDSSDAHRRFNPGDEVSFGHPTLGRQTGTLIEYKEKTVSILTRSGQKWDVSPHLLRKSVSPRQGPPKEGKIIPIK